MLDDREMHIEDLEGRVANAEAAMHTATATMEEQAEALSPSAQAGPTEDKSPEEALLEPRLPDISEKGLSRGANLHSEQVEQLEELVAELRAELQDLQESHVHQRGQLQATQVLWTFSPILKASMARYQDSCNENGSIDPERYRGKN